MKQIDSIIVKNGKITAYLNWFMFYDQDIFVGIIPTLQIAAHSEDEKALTEELNEMVKNYFEHYFGEKLNKQLTELGWKDFNPSESINLPTEILMYEKIESRTLEYRN